MKIERLEPRNLLAAAVDAGRLLVEGTSGNDKITVALHPNFANVLCVSVNEVASYFSIGSVKLVDIRAGDGDDSIDIDFYLENMKTVSRGGVGRDSIRTNNANDTIFGNDGNDRIVSRYGGTYAVGGSGDDYIIGGYWSDTLSGDAGNDVIQGMNGNDLIYGGQGNDALFGGFGRDTIHGNAGDDNLYGTDATALGENRMEEDRGYGDAGHDWFDGSIVWKKVDFNPAEDSTIQNRILHDPGASTNAVSYSSSTLKNGSGTLTLTGTNTSTQTSAVPSLLNIYRAGYLYDGLSVPNESPVNQIARSQTARPADLTPTQISNIESNNLMLPKSWKLTQVAVRQGDLVWYRVRTQDDDHVKYTDTFYSPENGNFGGTMSVRYLVVKKGTTLLPATARDEKASVFGGYQMVVYFPARSSVILAGDPSTYSMSDQFDSVAPLRKGVRGLLVDGGAIWFTRKGHGVFVPL